ncbi:unnamed protein product, partial [Polarella glacialis]
MTVDSAREDGWLYTPISSDTIFSLWSIPRSISWTTLSSNWPTMLLAVFTGPFLNNVGDLAVVEGVIADRAMGSSNFDAEVKVQGFSYFASALTMGYPSDFGNDDVMLHRVGGGKTRLSSILNCMILGAFVFISGPSLPLIPAIVSVIPKFVNGASMLLAGMEMLFEPILQGRKSLPAIEYGVIWAVVF